MRPSGRQCLYASLAVFCLALASRTSAESLNITSSPPGASVEINGRPVGNTPYKTDYPGGYFHKPHTVFSPRLDHSMIVKISLDGYLSEQLTLTQGPFEWVAISGRHHGSYFLLKSSRFHIELDPVYHGSAITDTNGHEGPLGPAATAMFHSGENETPAQNGAVVIGSEPSGAEIYIDGKFVGETPSTFHLAMGPHRIELKCSGKQEWLRDLEVLKDSQLTLHPVLNASP